MYSATHMLTCKRIPQAISRATLNGRRISNAPLKTRALLKHLPVKPVVIYTATRRIASAVPDAAHVSFSTPPNHREFLISHVEEAWPSLSSVPLGWSCAWKNWPYLMTLYWPSPYYLMLPQIEMIINIRHRMPGETRPLLFSNQLGAVIFTFVASPAEFFFLEIAKTTLYRIGGVKNELELTQLLAHGDEALEGQLHLVPPDAEGEKALDRLLKRDALVIPVLAKDFLQYEPTPTEQWEELVYMQVGGENGSKGEEKLGKHNTSLQQEEDGKEG